MNRGALISLVVMFDLLFIGALIAALSPATILQWTGSEVTLSDTTLWATIVLAGLVSAALTAITITGAKS